VGNKITNYDGGVVATPQQVVRPETVDELRAILKSTDRFPSPVRAMGSFHSLTPCAASPGTMVDMSAFNKIVDIDAQKLTLTAQAGLQLVAAAAILRKKNLQFMLNAEIGNITLGSAACCHSKDALDCIEYGQLSSYVTGIKWVNPSGELEEAFEENNRDLLYLVRSSHGLCGIIYEVTFRLKPMEIVKFTYLPHKLEELTQDQVTSIIDANEAIVCWTIGHSVFIQTRNRTSQLRCAWLGGQRRDAWRFSEALISRAIRRYTPGAALRKFLEDLWFAAQRGLMRFMVAVGGMSIWDPDKIINYERTPPRSRYAFTFWAFPRDEWVSNLKAYAEFAERYFKKYGFRCNMPLGSYYVKRDRSAILSYTYDGDVISIDPIHAYSDSDKPAWEHFLREFNAWSHARGGIPLLNQSPFVERKHLVNSYGDRWRQFSQWVRTVDPEGRMLNPFFEELLSEKQNAMHPNAIL
jgi:FAD/FMN-containing dehydrogenase